MPAIQLNGTQLEYVEKGQGDPVVFVHGTLADFRSWELHMEPFAQEYRAIAYSRRYHYPNPWSGDGSDYSPVTHADDLAAFMNGLGLESAHVVGHSYGAYTALFSAVRHPERVRALVRGEPPAMPLLEHNSEGLALREALLKRVWRPAGERLRRGDMEDGVRTFVDGVVGKSTFDQSPPEIRSMVMDNARKLKAETSAPDYFASSSSEDAGKVTASTLLLTGEKSLRLFHLIADELQRCLPDSVRASIPQSSHEMVTDNPDAFREIVLGFLDEAGRATSPRVQA